MCRGLHAIEHCRDGTFGHAVFRCDGCGKRHFVDRSCGNRHCPTCQQHKVEQWLGRELDRLLPCECFLVTFGDTIDAAVWKKPWVIHALPVGDGRNALRYLARYVFRVAISNSRIVSCDTGRVVFRYRPTGTEDGSLREPNGSARREASGRRWRTMSLDAFEFIRRFLQHVLPRGFQKVRHYGFLSPASRQSIAQVRRRVEDYTFQLTLTAVALAAAPACARPVTCPQCGGVMRLECLVLANGKRCVPRRLVLRSTLPQRRAVSAVDST